MTKAEIYSKILEISEKSYYRWKSKDHPILINLIERYFSDDELEEFFRTTKIKKFEKFNFIQKNIMDKNQKLYLKSFNENLYFQSLQHSHSIFIDFYFYFLVDLKKLSLKGSIYDNDFNQLLFSSMNSFLLKKYNKKLLDSSKIKKEAIESLNIENETNLKNIQKHTSCFKNWDSDMLFYLDYILSNNLQSFLDSGNEELIYHSIGFNIFYYVETNSLDESTLENIFHDIISYFIKNKKNKSISINELYLHIDEFLKKT